MAEIWGKSMDLGIWNENQGRNEILDITACPDLSTFFLNLEKNHRFGHLETIWVRFSCPKYSLLGLWVEKQIMAGTQNYVANYCLITQ